ncbi:hypothetical protein [Psychromonas sp. KJ10-2]|uniref:hypothetical protein n=1 Tax=Psychromonas sp. KJ10-2 TaxID=3391822 RepID=UPI0039B52D03
MSDKAIEFKNWFKTRMGHPLSVKVAYSAILELETLNDSALAAIDFALNTEDGLNFLQLWSEGEFDVIRKEWSDAPEEIYIGSDPLHVKTGGNGKGKLEQQQLNGCNDRRLIDWKLKAESYDFVDQVNGVQRKTNPKLVDRLPSKSDKYKSYIDACDKYQIDTNSTELLHIPFTNSRSGNEQTYLALMVNNNDLVVLLKSKETDSGYTKYDRNSNVSSHQWELADELTHNELWMFLDSIKERANKR